MSSIDSRGRLSRPTPLTPQNWKIPSKSCKNLKNIVPDSLVDRFHCNQSWFQVELNELYRFQGSFIPPDPSYPPKLENTIKKLQKSQKYCPGFARGPIPLQSVMVPSRTQ